MVGRPPERRHSYVVIHTLLILAIAHSSHAFFPTTWRQSHYGNSGVSHEQQTEIAFERLAQKYFPSTNLSRSMLQARDAISLANTNVDSDYGHSAFHCDGENFDGAQLRLTDLKNKTITAVKSNDTASAYLHLGSALHTVQDFYSHSNWVEMGHKEPHPDLGRGKPIVHAAFANATCAVCGPTTRRDADGCPICTNQKSLGLELNYLTSGYAFQEDSPGDKLAIPDTKCHHGGYIDSISGPAYGFLDGMVWGTSMPGINKDSLACGFSPHFFFHHDAVNLSIEATVQYIDDIKQELSGPQLQSLFGVGRTYSFFLDVDADIKLLLAITAAYYLWNSQNSQSAGARDWKWTTWSKGTMRVETATRFDALEEMVNRAVVSADKPSMDCGGLSLDGILSHINTLEAGSDLFIMAGSLPENNEKAAEIVATAFAKDITIHSFFMPFGCSQIENRANYKINGLFKPKTIYDSFASATGGSTLTDDLSLPPPPPPLSLLPPPPSSSLIDKIKDLVGLKNQDNVRLMSKRAAEAATVVFDSLKRQDSVRILSIQDSLPSSSPIAGTQNPSSPLGSNTSTRRISFPIDSTITELKVALRGANIDLSLENAAGTEVHAPPSIVRHNRISKVELPGALFFTIKQPSSGSWTAVIEGSGAFSLDIYGTTTLLLSAFDLVRFAGRDGHQGFFPVSNDGALSATAGANITAIGAVEGPPYAADAVWAVQSLNGTVVNSGFMESGSGELGFAPIKSFFGTMVLPETGEFVVRVSGVDERGAKFQRVWGERIIVK